MYIHLLWIQILDTCSTEESPATETLGKVGGANHNATSMPHHPETAAPRFPPQPVAPRARSVPPSGSPSTRCPQCSAASVRRLRQSRAHLLLRSQSAWTR